MDDPVKRATISAGRHPSGPHGRVDTYKSHLSTESKSNEANADRYVKKIKPRVHTASGKASKIDFLHHNKTKQTAETMPERLRRRVPTVNMFN